jgi:hypothetical protein
MLRLLVGADSPPDKCICDWSVSRRRKTKWGDQVLKGKLVRISTEAKCPVHGKGKK